MTLNRKFFLASSLACLLCFALPLLALAQPSKGKRSVRPGMAFENFDANGDGQMTLHEFQNFHNKRHEKRFRRYDADGDGSVSRDEYDSYRDRRKQRAQGRRRGPKKSSMSGFESTFPGQKP